MNEWLKKVFGKIKDAWKKWKPVQKIIGIAIVVAVITAIILAATLSSRSTEVRVFNSQSQNTAQLNRAVNRIQQEGIEAHISDGYIYVEDKMTASRMFDMLLQEGLAPSDVDPWEGVFKRDWSTTDADQNQKIKIATEKALEQHITNIQDISSATVTIVLPEKGIFSGSQDPVTASVMIYTKPLSNFTEDRKRIQGLQRFILSAVQGLREENLTIIDSEGNQLNDFEGLAESDRINNTKKQQKMIQEEENRYKKEIQETMDKVYPGRVALNIRVEIDFNSRTSERKEFHPITFKEDNPKTPFDDSEYRDAIPRSQSTVTRVWEGTGYNPEGPAGVEGQTPAVYSDMSNVIGSSTETGVVVNNELNEEHITEVYSPKTSRVTLNAFIDGKWKDYATDPKNGKPIIKEDGHFDWKYEPVPEEDLEKIADGLEAAIGQASGYDLSHGYMVVVRNLQFDHDNDRLAIEQAYHTKEQRKKTIILVLISVLAVLIGFVLFKVISRELERRRRLREEELLRKQQAAREAALWEAKDEGMEVTMSVEETRRMELQENAINMAKEHPEDVAMLIRTWLMEE